MITTRGAAGRAVLSFAQQVGLSVLGTLAATVVVTALKSEWATRPAMLHSAMEQQTLAPAPGLTPGGKFSARAITGDEPEPLVIVTTLPPMLPLFTAAAFPLLNSAVAAPRAFTATLTATVSPDLEPRARVAPVSIRHPRPHATAAAPLPPQRDATAESAQAPRLLLSSPAHEDTSFWARSRSAYRQVADWSDEIVDRLLP